MGGGELGGERGEGGELGGSSGKGRVGRREPWEFNV